MNDRTRSAGIPADRSDENLTRYHQAMNTATQHPVVTAMRRHLRNGPATLEQLLDEHAALWHDLGWDAAQVSLWLACTSALRQCPLPGGETGWMLAPETPLAESRLGDELVALLHQAGRPMPLTQLMGKLPAGRVVTEPMLRAAAQQDARLELKGPLLKLA